MELKSGKFGDVAKVLDSSNRTFMELKWEFEIVDQVGTLSSNRTFMELKYFIMILFCSLLMF